MEVNSQGYIHSARFTAGKETRYPSYKSLVGLQGRSWRVRKISTPLGFDPRIFQPIASSYTDWAVLPHLRFYKNYLIKEVTIINLHFTLYTYNLQFKMQTLQLIIYRQIFWSS